VHWLLAPAVAGATSLLLLWWMLGRASNLLPLDQPNERSLHQFAVPRTGGAAVMAGLAATLPWLSPELWVPVGIALVLALLSFVDDVRGLSVGLRLALHAVAAGAFLLVQLQGNAMWLVPMLLGVMWMTNLYNFMDGMDGFSGGMAVFGFGAMGVAATLGGDEPLALANFALVAAAAAFLCFNFPPARIFMGDAGSIPLGFIAGALGVTGWKHGLWPLWFPLLVFAPFVIDASVTLCRRLLRGEHVWQAHREHYYQRLVRMGWTHRKTVLTEYLLMTVCAAAGLVSYRQAAAVQGAALAAVAVLFALLMWQVDRAWKSQPA
jgi:UDP-N-acetylmuramyl pentapeptide phosphotransferase/UDP-N-acetylglucosamine-1-phosphate transferase